MLGTGAASDIVRQVLEDPPLVHDRDGTAGVWSTDAECYQFLAAHTGPEAAVLETGCGVSTAVLTLTGATLTSVSMWPWEASRLRSYCDERAISLDRVTLLSGSSHDILPSLAPDPLDLVFVDGGHGWPTPIIDATYGGRRLRNGGFLVLDDLPLPAVAEVARVLDADPGWQRRIATKKWGAWELVTDDGAFSADHYEQPWIRQALPTTFSEAAASRFTWLGRMLPAYRRVRGILHRALRR